MEALNENVMRFVGKHPSLSIDEGGVVAGAVYSRKEAVVIDTLFFPEDAKKIRRYLEEKGFVIRGVINTHSDADHVWGNQFFGAVQIIAHEKTLSLMKKQGTELLRSAKKSFSSLKNVSQVFPTQTYTETFRLSVGEIPLVLYHMPGHTSDSSIVHLPQQKILFAGDVVIELPFVKFDSRKLLESLHKIKKMDVDIIVQGHGSVCGKKKIQSDISYLESIRKLVQEQIDSGITEGQIQGIPLEECLSEPRKSLPRDYAESIHHANLEQIRRELTNIS
ncbi:MAG: MBL fold metallo-hydrolase [Candidatus Heimdallarchaeota archaeon]